MKLFYLKPHLENYLQQETASEKCSGCNDTMIKVRKFTFLSRYNPYPTSQDFEVTGYQVLEQAHCSAYVAVDGTGAHFASLFVALMPLFSFVLFTMDRKPT